MCHCLINTRYLEGHLANAIRARNKLMIPLEMGQKEKEETDYGVYVQPHSFYLTYMSSPTYYVIEECDNGWISMD